VTERLLEGNGAALVRERSVAMAVQRALERVYQLEHAECVSAFLHPASCGARESLVLREAEDGAIEIRVHVPALGRKEIDVHRDADLDPLCQLIEGVSHFVYIAERAKSGRESTQLELELQAEVDKYVVLAGVTRAVEREASEALRRRLYELVSFAHDEVTAEGERYRVANALAKSYVRKLERDFVLPCRFEEMRRELRRFYRFGQEEKLRAARAA
jgi:hypothetical protein